MDTPCIIWTGSLNGSGYGNARFQGKKEGAHRVAWIKAHGEISKGMVVKHSCGQRACVNIDHLSLGTQSENILESVADGTHPEASKTHCPAGHPYDEENTYVPPGRHARHCRACMRSREMARAVR